MEQEYYYFNKDELLESPRIPLTLMADEEAIFRAVANEMTEEICRNNERGEKSVLIVPVGPVGQYPYFVELINSRRISLKNVWFINMDEYLNADGFCVHENHPLSFRGIMRREVYSRIDPDLIMPEGQRIFPDPQNPGATDSLIAELGGVDAVFGGIGINGHVAFNEPQPELSREEFCRLNTRVLHTARETRAVNSLDTLNGAMELIPELCVTVGFRQIINARKVRLAVFRHWHKAVVRRAAHGPQGTDFPVSLLQGHPDAGILLTEYTASLR